MSTSALIAKSLAGENLTEVERSVLSPPLLAHLAIGGHIELTPSDRRRLSKTMLAQLAIAGHVELTRSERDSLSPHAVALLAASGRIELQEVERARLSRSLRAVVERANQRRHATTRRRGSDGKNPSTSKSGSARR